MTSFVDTSALLALVNVADPDHAAVSAALKREDGLVTHNYVIVETEALVRRRLGATASSLLLARIPALADVGWVDRDLHERAARRLDPRGRRASLVDEVSFAFMRDRGLETAVALDEDFVEEGFRTLPW